MTVAANRSAALLAHSRMPESWWAEEQPVRDPGDDDPGGAADEVCEIRVTHWPDGILFPEGPSRDFSAFHARKHKFEGARDGRTFRSLYRFWDPYSAYAGEPLPTGQPLIGRAIDNVHWVPSQGVLDRMLTPLTALASVYSVIWWDSAIQCFPYVARHLKRLFRLCIVDFGDDLPGSSDIKTFPVCTNFDVLAHAMYIWDPVTGKTVPQAYAERGLKDCRLLSWRPPFGGVFTDAWFDHKMARLRAGHLPIRLVWLGSIGIGPARRKVMQIACSAFSGPEILTGAIRIHGNGLGGQWAGSPPALYADAVFGLNVAESSLFNGRFSDLCMSGTVQVAYDPHQELPRFGFLPGKHYICYDGSAAGLRAALAGKAPSELAAMAEAARAKFIEHRSSYNEDKVRTDIYFDYERQIREGRA